MLERKRIYVADDEQIIAKTICLILTNAGYECSFFFSAEAILEAVTQHAPDLVLSDVVLTGPMTGIDLAEIIADKYAHTRVMLLSGQAQTSELLDKAQERGFQLRVHAKPIHPGVMLQEIATLLSTSPTHPDMST